MAKGRMKAGGIGCLVICAICIFVAIERYNTMATSVRTWNAVRFPGLTENRRWQGQKGYMKPFTPPGFMTRFTPTETKYALLFAVISGLGGAVLLLQSGSHKDP